MMKYSQRGQALVETAIALPLVLFSLALLFWSAKYAIMTERMETATRYTQEILAAQNLYTNYSLPSLYNATSQGYSNVFPSCPTPPGELLSQTGPVMNNNISFPRSAIWQTQLPQQPQCGTSRQAFSSLPTTRNIVIEFANTAIYANLEPLFPLKGVGTIQMARLSPSLYQSDSIADMTRCLGGVTVIEPSLADATKYTVGEFSPDETLLPGGPQDQSPPTFDPGCTPPKLDQTPVYNGSEPSSFNADYTAAPNFGSVSSKLFNTAGTAAPPDPGGPATGITSSESDGSGDGGGGSGGGGGGGGSQ